MGSRECGLVIYDSKFGNTEKEARSLAKGLKLAGVDATCLNTNDVQVERVRDYGLIAIGAPTQAFTASRPMKDFLHKLADAGSRGKTGICI
ncbi:MAG TPA: flavodoxin domain-containing protein [Candidatus Bathyarchaeia archaeon]|nr:flavodoxin domain-containing protein [Candidatus Bathyarchaeia archaeon]